MSDIDRLLAQVAYQNRPRVRSDLINLNTKYRALNFKVGKLMHNNGTESTVVLFTGTIPINYLGSQYHIPVEGYIPELYPGYPPKVYVRPTANMVIKVNHKHVDADGLVYMQYLHSWSPANAVASNLVGVCDQMISIFSAEPPLFTKQAASAASSTAAASVYSSSTASTAQPNTIQSIYQSQMRGENYNSSISTSATATSATVSSYPTLPPAPFAYSGSNVTYGSSATSASYGSTGYQGVANNSGISGNPYYGANTLRSDNPTHPPQYSPNVKSHRETIEEELAYSFRIQAVELATAVAADIDKVFESQALLEEKKEGLSGVLADLAAKKTSMETNTTDILNVKLAELEAWAKKEEETEAKATIGKSPSNPKLEEETPPSDAAASNTLAADAFAYSHHRLECFDGISKQLIRLQAEVAAIDDTIYYLDYALAHGEKGSESKAIDMNTFLKETRKLARKQFLCQYHIKKINRSIEQKSKT